ncbi:hypothetical protein ACIQW9_10325 [Herminiimonas sp. NPDC097707]|uniref:hypothetical protein n=1 Tax=Herminiimonas sp. NPDC097707 TaxID=3364007 RepID=UPI003839D7C5
MLELTGLVLAMLGLLFAFDTPRRKLIAFFRKTPSIVHSFKIHTHVHVHNDGKTLGPLGTNKTDKTYNLAWSVTNNTDGPLQIERGIFMRQAKPGMPEILFTPPEFTEQTTILIGHSLTLLEFELIPRQIEHYRHWMRECSAFGLKSPNGQSYFIPNDQFTKFGLNLQTIALEHGLPETVKEGKKLVIEVKKNI